MVQRGMSHPPEYRTPVRGSRACPECHARGTWDDTPRSRIPCLARPDLLLPVHPEGPGTGLGDPFAIANGRGRPRASGGAGFQGGRAPASAPGGAGFLDRTVLTGRSFVAPWGPDFGDGLERWFGAQPRAAGPPGRCPATVCSIRTAVRVERAFAYIGARAFPRAPADPLGRAGGTPPRASGVCASRLGAGRWGRGRRRSL
jgi:hypothetical protein